MISVLITKYLNGEATEQEISLVFDWIEVSKENKSQFIDLKKTWAISQVSDFDKKTSWSILQKSIYKTKPLKVYPIYKYAAILIIFISLGSLIWLSKEETTLKTNSVVLELEDSNTKIDLVGNQPIIKDELVDVISEQSENEIVYKKENTILPISYHTLNIPYGQTYKVTLSDGSIVYLNAGSSLKYPKQFNTADSRKVFLQGEAFFKVEKDNMRPFIVEANKTNIKVLGTEFNVNTIKSQAYIECVLVEGSVQLFNNNNDIMLIPEEKATWNATSKTFDILQVNTKLYTSWINGELVFEDSSFNDISKKLTQFFNIKIENQNIALRNQKFSGTISIKNSSIENILDLLSLDTPFSYTNDNNTITISNNQP